MCQPMKPCPWAQSDPLYRRYHDEEWGVPLTDDRKLFELLLLEGMQAGLSWLTILRKRPALRQAFAGFVPERLAAFTEADEQRLLQDEGIIRSKRKIRACVRNAKAFLNLVQEQGSFARYLWDWVDFRPVISSHRAIADVPTQTETSQALSRDLKKRGFSFVGPVICQAYLQSAGLFWDHLISCPRHAYCQTQAYHSLWPCAAHDKGGPSS